MFCAYKVLKNLHKIIQTGKCGFYLYMILLSKDNNVPMNILLS